MTESRAYRPKSSEEISRNMGAIRSVNNRTESALRKTLHRMGFRYRKYPSKLPGRPDLAFMKERLAVFVDGDYWHGRLLREQGLDAVVKQTRRNADYWINKFERNVRRDDEITAALKNAGWDVIRLWESDVRNALEQTALQIAYRVRARRSNERQAGKSRRGRGL